MKIEEIVGDIILVILDNYEPLKKIGIENDKFFVRVKGYDEYGLWIYQPKFTIPKISNTKTSIPSPLNEALTFQNSLFSIWSIDGIERLAALSGEVGRQAVMIGYINAFYAFCMTAFAICPFLFLAKVKKYLLF